MIFLNDGHLGPPYYIFSIFFPKTQKTVKIDRKLTKCSKEMSKWSKSVKVSKKNGKISVQFSVSRLGNGYAESEIHICFQLLN